MAFVDKLAALNIELATLDMHRGLPDPRAVLRLASLLRRWNPAVLHCHMVHANLLGRIVRVFVKIPVLISTAHSINEGGRVRDIAYRITDFLTDITTNVSQPAVDRFIEKGAVPKKRIRLMINGVDTTKFIADKKTRERVRRQSEYGEEFVWVAIGRIEAAKDYSNMLRAFKQVLFEGSARLIIIGDGPLRQALEQQIRNLGIQNSVEMLGSRDDVKEYLNAADAYVMSSAWEGLPIVLLEAAAMNLPIVCTDVGGNREVVVSGKTGYVVPAGYSGLLSSAMLDMMRLPESTRTQMGIAGRKHVEDKFSLEHAVDQWESLYWKLLSINTPLTRRPS